MYHPIKFGRKRMNSSVDMVETVVSEYMSLHCNFEPDENGTVFSPDGLAYHDALLYKVWLNNVWSFRGVRPDKH